MTVRARLLLRTAWVLATGFFALALFATGQAGPFYALWGWTFIALPLWVATTIGRSRLLRVGLLATVFVSAGIFAITRLLETRGAGVPTVLGDVFLTLLLGWPFLLASSAWRVLRPPTVSTDTDARAP